MRPLSDHDVALATFAAADRFFAEHPVLGCFQGQNEVPLAMAKIGDFPELLTQEARRCFRRPGK